jgi:CPA2 family monovalent cation:H+ antiporter-2
MAPHLPRLIVDLATVLGVAALTTLLFRRLKQPVVLGYLLAGLIVGPNVPIPLVAAPENVQTLAELGVILVMFSVGLEFDFRKLAREGLPAVVLGVFQAGVTTWLGFLAGRALGWGIQESTLVGAALAVSSTMIIAKLFQEQGGGDGFRGLVLSVGLLQDLYAILLLAGMDTSSAASGGIGWALARVGLFLAGLLALGGLLLPPLLRWAADHGRDETLLVASVGACFTCAVMAAKSGCSPALGAFGAGMLAATSRRGRPIERLVLPLRDMFGAIFFVAVGMLLDPRLLL